LVPPAEPLANSEALDAPATPRSGRAIDALRHHAFRRVYTGAFLSNVGTWMQNVVLGALAYDLTGSSAFVGLVLFAQLGPMLFFSMVGGLLADSFDRRRLLVSISAMQALLTLGLAAVTRGDAPNEAAVVGIVFLIGMGQSVFGPAYSALLPDLVGPGNLAGAISLNSAQMNGSRVIGPAIGGFLFATYGASWVFVVNAATFAFVIGALLSVELPEVRSSDAGEPRLQRLAGGFRIARDRHPVGRCLCLMVAFSLLCLPFVGQMPVLADRNLDIAVRSTAYGWLYACFGLGAMLGALSIGTVFANTAKERLVRDGLVAFAACLAVFAWLRAPGPAFVMITAVGFCYFATVTALSTVLQTHLASHERGRVMALWMMAFGGTVPIGNLLAGPLIDATSVTTVVLPGAIIALVLARYADLSPRPSRSGLPSPESAPAAGG
jgi:MFS family permease